MVLSNYIEEIVVSAVSYHLMNNKEPEYRNGKLVISSKSVVIMKDGLGRSKGFGFVSFQEPELAQKAMDAMNDSMLGPAQKKAEREKLLKEHFGGKYYGQCPKMIQASYVYSKDLKEPRIGN